MDQNPPKEVRSPVNLRIKFRSESLEQFIERYAVDVSRGGIFIRTREPLAVGTQLKLDFQYQNGGPLMAGDGTVVWIRDPDPSRPNIPPGMGVRFDRLSPESQAVLELLLADKVKREKSGIAANISPIAGNAGSAGIAVRRPSSMFAALEPQGPGNGPRAAPFTSQLPITGAMLPTAPPPPKGGPVTSILIVPAEAKALGSVSGPAAPPAGSPPAASTSTNVHLAETPATGMLTMKPLAPQGTPENPAGSSAAPGTPGYRPLGTTKNPFAGLQKLAPAPPAARLTSTISTTGKSLGGGLLLPRDSQSDAGRHEGTPDDDINEEPTQIAGRVPSFLMTDDDPTSVGTRPSQAPSDEPTHTANQAALLADLNRMTARGAAHKPLSSEPPPDAHADTTELAAPPVPGPTPAHAFAGPLKDLVSDLATRQQKQSLDLAPPVGDQGPQPAKAPDRTTDALLDPEAAPLASSGKITVSRRNDALALAAAATDVRAQAPRKRSGALVGVIVVVLGGVGLFAYRYFSAHQTTPVPAPAGDVATGIAPAAAPVPAAPAAAEPAPAQPEAKTEIKKPGEEPPAAAPVAAAPAAAAPAAVPPPEPAAAKEPEPAPAPEPSKKVAVAEPAASAAHKGANKKKGGRAGHEAETASAKAIAAGVPDTLPPAEAPPAPKAAEKTAEAGHQLRVTSKPSGADVSIDGQVIGQTPLATGIADVSAPHFVSVHKDGYEPFEQMISASSAWAKSKPAKGQPAVPTLKLNAKLKGMATPEGKAAPSAESAAKEPAKETSPPPVVPAAAAPTPKAEEPKIEKADKPDKPEKIDRPLPPSDDRLPPSTP